MAEPLRVQDFSAAEIAALLEADGSRLDAEQIAALQEFIAEIGGIENARSAVEMLGQLEDAA